jgi:hypothetical protein
VIAAFADTLCPREDIGPHNSAPFVAVTDGDWFKHLSARTDLEEVNFWAPSAGNFRVWCKRYLALGYRLGWQASRR